MIETIVANQMVIVGTLVLACFGAYLTWRNGYKGRVAAASTKFRATVLAAFSGLYPHEVNWPSRSSDIAHMLKEKFPELQAAVSEFRPYVPWWRRRAFDKAWFMYRLGPDGREIDKQMYHQYMPFVSTSIVNGSQVTVDNSKTHKENFKRNVESLLRYADET